MHAFVLALGFAFNGAVVLVLVYRSRFMQVFYQAVPVATTVV